MRFPSSHRPAVRARIAFGVWTAIILATTVPWTDLVGHTHWGKVQWIPFVTPPVKLLDVVVNLLLYCPFGYELIRATPPRVRGWHAAAIAGSLSLAVEWSQLYSHSRFPSTQDLLCNVSGAWVGAAWAGRGRPRY
jgi:glycopeptide antibiotics resistance protein